MHGWICDLNRDSCQRRGGDLVSIEAEEEWNFIIGERRRRNTKRSCGNRLSIGLTKKAGNWTWVNGRPLTICKWGQGKPSGKHNATFMYKQSCNSEWGVFGIGISKEAYICKISNGKCFLFLHFCLLVCLFFNNYIIILSKF